MRNFSSFKEVLNRHFKKNIIGYSFKTNALPAVVETAKDNGCYAEVVSDDEYRQALTAGFSEQRIIFNGPVKNYDLFKRSIECGGIVNIDSQRELQWLREFDQEGIQGQVGIRVNFDVESVIPGTISAGKEGSRFGFCLENGELQRAIDTIQKLEHISLSGFHMHVGSKDKNQELFYLLAKKGCELYKKYGIKEGYIDIGGGFFGGGDDGVCYENYIKKIKEATEKEKIEDFTLIVEPGSSVIANPFSYLFEVIEAKDTAINHFVVTNGERIHIDPFLRKDRYSYQIIRSKENYRTEKYGRVVCGSTCMENDRIFTTSANDGTLAVGDRILIDTVGSYTMCFNSNFIHGLPYVYQKADNTFTLIRDKWTPAEIFQNCFSTYIKPTKNILILNAGSRNKLVSYFMKEADAENRVITTDNFYLAPALYETSSRFITRPYNNERYIDDVLKICDENNIGLVVSVLDPELTLLSEHANLFKDRHILLNTAPPDVIARCGDKLETIKYLKENGFNYIPSASGDEDVGLQECGANYPFFVKPRNDSGSAGIGFIENEKQKKIALSDSNLIIQKYMKGEELGVDVYIDLLSHEVVSIFAKKKLKMRSGETDKSVSFKDEKLFNLIKDFAEKFGLCGANDIDVFQLDGEYYISEVNPRFGGGYIHAYECGVNFPKMLINNMNGIVNQPSIGQYEEGIYMMKYFDVEIGRAQ